VRFVPNLAASRASYTSEEARIVSLISAQRALDEMRTWSGYAPTPLRSLVQLTEKLRLSAVFYKDESGRFGLGSFKALGGAYAAGQALMRRRLLGVASELAKPQVQGAEPVREVRSLTLCCATDGNHGRSVAFAGKRFGCDCVVFIHEHAPEFKVAAIRALGARVVRTRGTYDESVQIARDAARTGGWLLISDTSESSFDEVVAEVMQGYAVMGIELSGQLGENLPTHVFVQAGVGGLAAAIAGSFTELLGARRPIIVVVEPERAACLMESALQGAPARVGGDLSTVMDMLSCGEASRPAWTILKHRADAFVAIDDTTAQEALAMLRTCSDRGSAIDVGMSGAAGLAGLLDVLKHEGARGHLALDQSARVLLFGTEGADGQT